MLFCHFCVGRSGHTPECPTLAGAIDRQADDALAYLRAKLNGDTYAIGEGKVIFTRTDGRKVTLDRVRVDSISPGAENFGVVGVEFFGSDKVVHVPFVESWVIEY